MNELIPIATIIMRNFDRSAFDDSLTVSILMMHIINVIEYDYCVNHYTRFKMIPNILSYLAKWRNIGNGYNRS